MQTWEEMLITKILTQAVELDVVEYSKVDNTQYKINDKLEKRIKTLEQKVGK